MKILLLAAPMALVLALSAPPAFAQAPLPATETMFQATTLNLSAFGEVKVNPDQASIGLGVQTDAPSAAEAMRLNAQRMAQVVAALRRAGVPEHDVQTSGLSLSPQYRHDENQPPRLTGYQAANQVTITVNDLGRLGQTLDAAVNAGANQVHGVSFGLKNPSAAVDRARLEAVRTLQARAQLYASAAGLRVVRVVNLSEGGGDGPAPPPRPMYRMEIASTSQADTPILPGQLNVRVDVSGTYELTR